MFSNLTPSEPRLSPAATISDDMLSALTQPLHCASILQPATPPQVVAFDSAKVKWLRQIGPSLIQFVSIISLLLNHGNSIFEPVCVFTFSSSAFAFLIEMNFSFKSLFAVWSSPQRFHYYFYLSIVSWQYQKYWTILILVLCRLCVTPLVCSSYSSFAPSSPFFSSWWQKDCELFTHTLVSNVLHQHPCVSTRRPMYLLIVGSDYCVMCFAYAPALHMRRQNLVPFPCLYIEPFELVIEIVLYYCSTPPCHKIKLFKRPFWGSRFERRNDAFVLLISLIFLYPQKILISVRWPFGL